MAENFRRQKQAPRFDPLEQAMQVYQMFNNPNNNELDAVLGLIQSQQTQEQRASEFETSRGLKERELGLKEKELGIEERKIKPTLTPEQIQVYSQLYSDPSTSAAMKLTAKHILAGTGLTEQIDAQAGQLAGDIAGPGGVQAQPPTGGGPMPNPLAIGAGLGNAARGALGFAPTTQPFDPIGLLKGLFQDQSTNPPPGSAGEAARRANRPRKEQ